MKKKIIFGLAILFFLTTSLSAQADYMYEFRYLNNLSEQMFISFMSESESPPPSLFRIIKLPSPVYQSINNNLRDYSLDIGDVFLAWVGYQGKRYCVFLRITDKRYLNWQYYAWRNYGITFLMIKRTYNYDNDLYL